MNIADLVPKLLETTQRKKIIWSAVMDNLYVARVGGRKFQISQGVDDDNDETFYRLNIYSGSDDAPHTGQFIDSMQADRFRGAYSDLEQLYAEARRNALGVDEIMSDIDSELNKLLAWE